MTVIKTCPSCGLESDEVRCPRCNALKVVGCSGSCALCKVGGDSCSAQTTVARPPSEDAREDHEHPGTPLER
jgi:hypothetical protein